MLQHGCASVEDYLRLNRQEPDVRNTTMELLTVSISRFFRDLRFWEAMEQRLLPQLVREALQNGRSRVNVWSAGCACGEEVYSLKILWHRLHASGDALPSMEIWATDFNPEVLARARSGIFSRSSLRELTPTMLKDCFRTVSAGFAIKTELKEGIHWLRHDFITQAPLDIAFDLIFLRNNLLTYYEVAVQVPAFLRILDALRPGGFLVIGTNEQIPLTDAPLTCEPEWRGVFRKQDAERGVPARKENRD